MDPKFPIEKKYSVIQNTLETDIVKNLRNGGMIAESEFDDLSENGPQGNFQEAINLITKL